MGRIHGRIYIAIAAMIAGWGICHAARAAEPTAAEIAAAIEHLGDERFQQREEASVLLWQVGDRAVAALEQAALSGDPEVAFRARGVLDKLRHGIFADTPAIAVRSIALFRQGPQHHQQALEQLAKAKQFRSIIALIQHQIPPSEQSDLARQYLQGAQQAANDQILAGKFDEAATLLEAVAIDDVNIRDWAAFLVMRGSTEAKQSQLLTVTDTQPLSARKLAWLLRAAGDLDGACAAAAKTSDRRLLLALRQEAGKWQELSDEILRPDGAPVDAAEDEDDDPFHGEPGGDPLVRRLGLHAAWHRLAGRRDQAERLLRQIEAGAAEKGYSQERTAALLLNDEVARGLAIGMRKRNPSLFRMLVWRQDFRQAFELAGVKEIGPPYERWFVGLGDDLRRQPAGAPAENEANFKLYFALSVAEQLSLLGESAEAKKLFAFVSREVAPVHSRYAGVVLRYQCTCDDRASALAAVAEESFDEELRPLWFRQCFGVDQVDAVEAIWRTLHTAEPEISHRDALAEIEAFLAKAPQQRSSDDWAKLVRQAIDATLGQSAESRMRQLDALANVSQLRNDVEAERTLRTAVNAVDGHSRLRELGEFYLRQRDWPAAIAQFAELAEHQPGDPLAIFLWGYALTQQGERAAGEEKMLIARLLPLARSEQRAALIAACQKLELHELARVESRLVVRSEEPGGMPQANAATAWGNAIVDDDPRLGSQLWQHLLLTILADGAFADMKSYLQLPNVTHSARGLALLAAGERENAWQEFELALAAAPGDIDLALAVVPALDKAGEEDRAKEVFQRVYETHERVLRDFPRSADHHNRAAWLAVRLRRRLDDAMLHAQRAVELAPKNTDYLDTLAEVHFARGDRAQAVALLRRCIELAPHAPQFPKRLAEFEKPSSLPAP